MTDYLLYMQQFFSTQNLHFFHLPHYVHWCAENGEKPVSNIRLGKELQRLGIERKKDMFGVFYYLHEIKHDEIQDNMTII